MCYPLQLEYYLKRKLPMTEPIFSQQDFDQRLFLVELLTILFCECWSVFRTGDGFNLDKSIKLFQKLHLSTDFLHFLSSAVSFCWNDDAPVLFSVVNFETSLHQSLHRHPWHCCIFSFAYLLVPECLIDSWSCHFSSKFSWALTHFHWHPCNCQAQCPNVAISKSLPWSISRMWRQRWWMQEWNNNSLPIGAPQPRPDGRMEGRVAMQCVVRNLLCSWLSRVMRRHRSR